MAKAEARDPLEKHIRMSTPGESARDRAYDLWMDRVAFWLMFAVVLFVWTATEFFDWLLDAPPRPWFMLTLFVGVASFAAWRAWRVRPQVMAMAQGARGELAMGQLLEELRGEGYRIFHDVDAGAGGNIDHVVIGPAGVFAVETKTISKPADRAAVVKYDGHRLEVDGRNPADFGDRDPLNQARAAAGRLRDILRDCTGRPTFVTPVLLYPGWWVEEPRNKADVWVRNPQRFIGCLRRQSRKLSVDDVEFFAANLTRCLRCT
jgi:hypothetical protein